MLIRKKKFKYAYFSFRTISSSLWYCQWCQILFRCSFLTMPLILWFFLAMQHSSDSFFYICAVFLCDVNPSLSIPFSHASVFRCCFRLHLAVRGKLQHKREIDFSLCSERILCLRYFTTLLLKSVFSELYFERNL